MSAQVRARTDPISSDEEDTYLRGLCRRHPTNTDSDNESDSATLQLTPTSIHASVTRQTTLQRPAMLGHPIAPRLWLVNKVLRLPICYPCHKRYLLILDHCKVQTCAAHLNSKLKNICSHQTTMKVPPHLRTDYVCTRSQGVFPTVKGGIHSTNSLLVGQSQLKPLALSPNLNQKRKRFMHPEEQRASTADQDTCRS